MADDGDTKILSFRRRGDGELPLPPLPPGPSFRPPVELLPDRDEDAFPALPSFLGMDPPLPRPPLPGISDGNKDSTFAFPAPEDPDHPKAREVLALAVALLTALGVAAAQGMWHRARHRQALADQARANADKATGKAVRRGARSSDGSSGSSNSRSLRGGTSRSRRRRGDDDRPGRGPRAGGPRKRRDKTGPDTPGPKATRTGKRKLDLAEAKKKRSAKKGAGGAKTPPTPKPAATDTPKNAPSTKQRNSRKKPPDTPRRPKLRWKAPQDEPGKNGSKSSGKKGDAAAPKRWTRGRPETAGTKKAEKVKTTGKGGTKPATKGTGPGTATPPAPRRAKVTRKAPKKTPAAGATGKEHQPKTTAKPAKPADSTKPTRDTPKLGEPTPRRRWNWRAARDSTSRPAPAPPTGMPPGVETMRPPPGRDRSTRATAEHVPPASRPAPQEREVFALPPAARPALPPPAPTRAQRAAAAQAAVVPRQGGARFVARPRTTQYRDAELTIYDVIDADQDTAEAIVEGVDDARATADGCDVLITRLEAVHSKLVELRVPGLLAGWMIRLIDKTFTVKARAEAIADRLPAAAEAISVAGSNAAARHKPLADVTRDMGHARPAERDYHNV